MKGHASIGARILENMFDRTPTQSYLKYAALIASSHHERYDGRGYPYGVQKEQIPLCGRIMAVADVYDAIVEARVYREAMTHEDACSIIYNGSGSQFDPAVVDSFDKVKDKIAAVNKSNREQLFKRENEA
jgi:putative two-component system response regulator